MVDSLCKLVRERSVLMVRRAPLQKGEKVFVLSVLQVNLTARRSVGSSMDEISSTSSGGRWGSPVMLQLCSCARRELLVFGAVMEGRS